METYHTGTQHSLYHPSRRLQPNPQSRQQPPRSPQLKDLYPTSPPESQSRLSTHHPTG